MKTFACPATRAVATPLAVVCCTGCSPDLNWRSVAVASVTAQLPCKPDYAQRTVELGGAAHTLSMWGCEAQGALFAVSQIRAPTPEGSAQIMAAWPPAATGKLKTTGAPIALAFNPPHAKHTGASAVDRRMLQATGQLADGKFVQAQWAWFAVGLDVYHLAVFAPKLTPAMTEPFFTELQMQ